MSKETVTQDYSKIISEFKDMLEIAPLGDIDEAHLSGGWELVGENFCLKIKAINRPLGIFVKYFSPVVGEYAQKTYNSLKELTQIEHLPFPILLPETLCEGALVFKAGEYRFTMKFSDLDPEVAGEMTKIVVGSGLKPLKRFDRLDVVEVEGNKYLVDPIEDSEYSISLYRESNKLV